MKEDPYMERSRDKDKRREESPHMEMSRDSDRKTCVYK